MDEKGVSGSCTDLSEEKFDSLYPMFFGVSCAFFALKLLPEAELCDKKWIEIRNRMLKGSVHLLGLFVWRVQREEEAKIGRSELIHKLEIAEKHVEELKKRRSEEAKANEKVVSIVAAREQSWFDERKKLRQQIGALMNELRVVEMNKEKTVCELNEKLKESEAVLESKDKTIKEGGEMRREIEERVKKAENLADELRESLKCEAQRHSSEISKHKTAFIELVSNQRQLEAELGRAVRQVEAVKQELDSVLEQKEEAVLMAQRVSIELVKMRKDLEQKDQILSAMLRKSKLDTAEKQLLLKEVKSSKAKRKQAELETAKWKAVSESKHERQSLRNMLSKHLQVKSDGFSKLIDDVDHMENWEAGAYKMAFEQRHNLELDAFAEQLRLKDEKLEAFRWRLLSTELESKRLKSHVEGLDHDIKHLRQENMKLKTLLMDRNTELYSLKEKLVSQSNPPNLQKLNVDASPNKAAVNHDNMWSKVKVIKRKPGQKRQETKKIAEDTSQEEKVDKIPDNEQHKDIVLTLKYPNKDIREGKVAAVGPDHFRQESISSEDVANAETSTSNGQGSSNKSNSTWRMDIHALGVSYKIKRLKQQFLMLERLTGKQESSENSGNNNDRRLEVDRYQSLQGKTDDLCQRMLILVIYKLQHENNLNLNCGSSAIARTEDETKMLEHFLEETFQLQRYIVATGQKLMEVQAKIASGLVDDAEKFETPESFDMKRFADGIRTLFREVQRGLEVRISRIIGDLEGTLACDGIIHFRK
ncbi:hypothetical protein CDL12_00122 [Handroanthus impetiginosus]|uniref:Uncharacterized protein n=1 Tax=Handroanthus impetiginosus TaxID=429701 RepID=A0A2G9IBK8_9LAMI|nr:hypothetical protein CDL12_00122 [Handroanthus impetiginosus]